MGINTGNILAGMRSALQPRFHSPDILRRIPQTVILCPHQCKHPCCGCPGNCYLLIAMLFQPANCLFNPLQGIIVVPVILFLPGTWTIHSIRSSAPTSHMPCTYSPPGHPLSLQSLPLWKVCCSPSKHRKIHPFPVQNVNVSYASSIPQTFWLVLSNKYFNTLSHQKQELLHFQSFLSIQKPVTNHISANKLYKE